MTRCVDLRSAGGLNLGMMTYPAYARLARRPLLADTLGVVMMGREGPEGLALGQCAGGSGRLFSVYVLPALRNQGRGAELLAEACAAAASRGARRLSAEVPLEAGGVASPIARRLAAAGWRAAGPTVVTVKTTPATIAGVLARKGVPAAADLRLEPWACDRPDPDWAPSDARPSLSAPAAPDGRPYHAPLSFAVLRGQDLFGWFLAHDMGEGWLRVTSHALHPDARPTAIFALWRRYFELAAAEGWRTATFCASEDHPHTFAFYRRRASEYADWWGCSAEMERVLDVAAAA